LLKDFGLCKDWCYQTERIIELVWDEIWEKINKRWSEDTSQFSPNALAISVRSWNFMSCCLSWSDSPSRELDSLEHHYRIGKCPRDSSSFTWRRISLTSSIETPPSGGYPPRNPYEQFSIQLEMIPIHRKIADALVL